MPRLSGRLGAVAAAAALLAAAYLLVRPAAVPVETAEVSRGPLQVTVDEEGETRVRERYSVSAPTTGWLLRIALDEGDSLAWKGLTSGRS